MTINLLKNAAAGAFLKSDWYPALPQALTAWVFVIVTWQLIAGNSDARHNLGSIFTWVLWWPMLPLVFLATGRLWCAVCPFGLLSDLVQKAAGRRRPVPKVMRTYGIWFIDVMFVLLTWADHVFGIFESPLLTGAFMLTLVAGVVVSGSLWQRRSWCRYLCFLGGLAGNYARNGIVELRAAPEICTTCRSKAACYNGTETVAPCPVFEFARTIDTSANCILCGNCVKSCPNGAIEIRFRPPSMEIVTARSPQFEEAFLAIVIMGIVLVKNASDTGLWSGLLKGVESATHAGPTLGFTLIFIAALSIPGLALALTSLGAQVLNGDGWKSNFTRFGYALIPLDMAAIVAHTCVDLLTQGGAIGYAVLALAGVESGAASRAIADVAVIAVLQIGLIVIGAGASLHAVHRIAESHSGARRQAMSTVAPYGAMIASFAAGNIYLFSLPKVFEAAASSTTYVVKDYSPTLYVSVIVGSSIAVTLATAWARANRGVARAKTKVAAGATPG